MQHWCWATQRWAWMDRGDFLWYLLKAHLCKSWTGCSTYCTHPPTTWEQLLPPRRAGIGAHFVNWIREGDIWFNWFNLLFFEMTFEVRVPTGAHKSTPEEPWHFQTVSWIVPHEERLTNIRSSESYIKCRSFLCTLKPVCLAWLIELSSALQRHTSMWSQYFKKLTWSELTWL